MVLIVFAVYTNIYCRCAIAVFMPYNYRENIAKASLIIVLYCLANIHFISVM